MVNPSLNDLYQRLKTADHPLPGGKIGKEIGVTKVAVWKMIGRLEDLGVHIQRSAKGYRLQERDPLHPFSFPGCQEKVHYSRETTSTMAAARELAQQRLWGHLAVAERQSQGRDRSGGAWNSPVGGLYLTVVLRPENSSLTDALTLGLRFLLELVEKLPLSAEPGLQVRWPGDLIYQGKKVGGVLLEGAGDNREWQYCCLGLGISIADLQPDRASPLAQTAPGRHEFIELVLDMAEHQSTWVQRNIDYPQGSYAPMETFVWQQKRFVTRAIGPLGSLIAEHKGQIRAFHPKETKDIKFKE